MRFKPGTIRRLLGYMSQYRVQLVLVVICILVSAFANAASALFLQRLIDDYISRFCWKATRSLPAWPRPLPAWPLCISRAYSAPCSTTV